MTLHYHTILAIIDLYRQYKNSMGNEAVFEDKSKNLEERLTAMQDSNRRKIVSLIHNLESEAKAELMAIMWIGRGDGTAKDFKSLKINASQMSDIGDAEYVTEKPLDEYLSKGLEMLKQPIDMATDPEA